MSSEILDDRQWLACRYLLDELSSPERDAFEARLATSQPLREALADAVELLQTVSLAEQAEIQRRKIRKRRGAWAAAVAASLLAVVGAGYAMRGKTGSQNPVSPEELAISWSETRELIKKEEVWQAWDSPEPPVETLETDGDWLNEDLETPDWLISAVASSEGTEDSEEMTDRMMTDEEG